MAASFFARRLWSLIVPLVFILCLTTEIAFSSLYPTKPISTTVFAAGRPAQVKWVEDGRRPFLGDLGHMKIHLLAGNSTYLSTIAEDVSPLLLSITVYIPQIIPANYHVYSLRFVPLHSPHRPIYTTPFTILPNPFSYLLSSSRQSNSATSAAPSEIVHTLDVSTASRITATQPATPTASGKYLPTQQDSSSFGNFEFGTVWGLGKNSWDPTVGRTTVRGVPWNLDIEKMQFRLVFIAWPALVGLSLSV